MNLEFNIHRQLVNVIIRGQHSVSQWTQNTLYSHADVHNSHLMWLLRNFRVPIINTNTCNALTLRGTFEKFVDWRQWAAVMQRDSVTVMPSCNGGGNVVVAWSSSLQPSLRVWVTVVLKEHFLGWRSNYEGRLKSSWTRLIRKRDRHRTSIKFHLGVIRWRLFKTTVTNVVYDVNLP
jgi:hypothetical protein